MTSTAAELNLLDNVSGLVQADLTKLAALDATAAEINLIDGGTSTGTTAVADADGIITNDSGTMRIQIPMCPSIIRWSFLPAWQITLPW